MEIKNTLAFHCKQNIKKQLPNDFPHVAGRAPVCLFLPTVLCCSQFPGAGSGKAEEETQMLLLGYGINTLLLLLIESSLAVLKQFLENRYLRALLR